MSIFKINFNSFYNYEGLTFDRSWQEFCDYLFMLMAQQGLNSRDGIELLMKKSKNTKNKIEIFIDTKKTKFDSLNNPSTGLVFTETNLEKIIEEDGKNIILIPFFKNNHSINIDESYKSLWNNLSKVVSNSDVQVLISLCSSSKDIEIKNSIKSIQLNLANENKIEKQDVLSNLFMGKNDRLLKEDKLEKLKSKLGNIFYVKLQVICSNQAIANQISGLLGSNYNMQWQFVQRNKFETSPFSATANIFGLFDISTSFLPSKHLFLANTNEVKNLTIPKIDQNLLDIVNIYPTLGEGENFINFSSSSNLSGHTNSIVSNLSLRQVFQNIIAFGDPGSGKSVGALANLIRAYFKHDFGMLVTVFKEEEAKGIIKLAQENNRLQDIVLLGPSNAWCTNILQEEYIKTSSIKSVIDLINRVNKAIKPPSKGGGGDQDFWDNQAEEMLEFAVRLAVLDGIENLTILNIENIILCAINKTENDKQIFQSYLEKSVENIKNYQYELETNEDVYGNSKLRAQTEDSLLGLIETYKYWTKVFPNISEKQINSVMTVVKTFFSRLKGGVIGQILFADSQRVKIAKEKGFYFNPSCTREGKIVVLNYSKEFYRETGATFQKIIKIIWQEAMQRDKDGSPCVLFSDEYQEFAIDTDADFLATSRSYRISFLVATQNITSLKISLGDQQTDKFLGNIQTKIFCKTTDTNTIEFCKNLVGKRMHEKVSDSISGGQKQTFQTNTGYSRSSNQELSTIIEEKHLHNLNQNCDFPKECQSLYFSQGEIFNSTNLPIQILTWKSIFTDVGDVWKKVNEQQSITIYPVSKNVFVDDLLTNTTSLISLEDKLKQDEVQVLISKRWFDLEKSMKLGRQTQEFFENLLKNNDENIKEFIIGSDRIVMVNIIAMIPLNEYKINI
jgi:TraM recognition site of TraD and TraG